MRRCIPSISAFLLIISLFICGPVKSQISEEPAISKIVIQIFPAFYTHSQIIFDARNFEMVFDMIGDVIFIKEDRNFDIKPFYYKFNSAESEYINDTILSEFDTEDFSDAYLGVTDGIGIDILFVFSDDNLKKIELSNNSTTNQRTLISFLLETMITNCSDSTTIAYSELINRYY